MSSQVFSSFGSAEIPVGVFSCVSVAGQPLYQSFEQNNFRISEGFLQTENIQNVDYEKVTSSILVKIYPNPTHSNITVETEKKGSEHCFVNVIDRTGRLILYKKIDENLTVIDVSNWTSDAYILQILNNQNKVISLNKIIKIQ